MIGGTQRGPQDGDVISKAFAAVGRQPYGRLPKVRTR